MTKYKKEETLSLIIAAFAMLLVLLLYFSNAYNEAINKILIIAILAFFAVLNLLRFYIKENFSSELFLMDASIDAVFVIVLLIQRFSHDKQESYLLFLLIWGICKSFTILFTSFIINKKHLINKVFVVLACSLLLIDSSYLINILFLSLRGQENHGLILNMFALGLMPATAVLCINYITMRDNNKKSREKKSSL